MTYLRHALLISVLPVAAYAVGPEDSPPAPAETTTVCPEGAVWDIATQSCMAPQDSTNDDSAMMDIIRELAYAARYDDALRTLEILENPTSDLALTYFGFSHRKNGDTALGMSFYERAIMHSPDNILARSYMGQAFVEQGADDLAAAQLIEIRMRGGFDTWAATALTRAIRTGETYGF